MILCIVCPFRMLKVRDSIIALAFYYPKPLLFKHHTIGKPQQKQFQ